MNDVSIFRLYFLRFVYLLVTVGLVFTVWPVIINHPLDLSLWKGVALSLLAAVSVLAALGIRYPLAMLPILFFELIWKIIWILSVAVPLWSNNKMDADHSATVKDCMVAIIILLAIPWGYVWRNYVTRPGDRWKNIK